MNRLTPKLDRHPWLVTVLFAVLVFVMMLAFLGDEPFYNDELENFAKGQSLAMGSTLYVNVGTQHMPLMYYLSALFSLAGCTTVASYRLCFYALIALLWGVIFRRYSRWYGRLAVALYPVLFILVISYVKYGATVLSEQLQAIGMAILLYELLRFADTREFATSSALMVGLAVMLSFWSSFVSLFAIFAVWLTVFVLEVRDALRGGLRPTAFLGHLIVKYRTLILAIVIPLSALVAYYAVTGALDDFVGWAYTINRTVYPRYQGGYGTSILESALAGLANIGADVSGSTGITSTYFVRLVVGFLAVAEIVDIHRRNGDWVLTGGLALFLVGCANRGAYANFHATPHLAALCVLAGLWIASRRPLPSVSGIRDIAFRIACATLALVCSSAYLTRVPSLLSIDFSSQTNVEGDPGWAVGRMADEGEEVGIGATDYFYVLLDSQTRLASSTGGTNPFFWEWDGTSSIEDLRRDPPRIYVFDMDLVSWGS